MTLQSEIVGLSVAYALLGVLLLLGVVRARLPWMVKAGAIALTSAFYVFVFVRTQGLLGWSATESLPPRFQLLWTRTVYPDPLSGNPGSVHLWLEALDDTNRPSAEPRAFRLPFSKALATKVEAARLELEKGHPLAGRSAELETDGDQPHDNGIARNPGRGADAGGDAADAGLLDAALLGGDSRSVEFAPLPNPTMPAKGGPDTNGHKE